MTKILQLIPRYSIYTLLIFTPLARASVQGWAITTIHMVTLIALTAFLLEKTLTNNWQWIRTPLDVPIGCLLLLCLLSTVFSVHPRTSIWSTILLINYIAIFYLTIHTIRTRAQIRQLVYLIIGMATFLAIFGFFKRAGMNPFPWWDYPDLSQHGDRVTATFGNANSFASYLAMAIPLVLGLLLTGIDVPRRFLLLFLCCLLLTALLLTLSRGGWIGAFAGLSFMTVALFTNRHFHRKKLVGAIVGAFLILSFIILASTPIVERIRTLEKGEGTPNFRARMTVWGGTTEMIKDHLVLGTGPGTFTTVFTQYQPAGLTARYFRGHNDYLQFGSEIGMPFIAIASWMVISLYRKGFQKLRKPSRLVRGVIAGAMSGITAMLVHSIFDFNLHIPASAILLTVITTVVVAPIDNSHKPKAYSP